jgi:CRISPR type IV-associated protein Csf1
VRLLYFGNHGRIALITAPQLFARAGGLALRTGLHRCYLCGGSCGTDTPQSALVGKSFTARDTVCGGDWICDGCVAAMNEQATISLACGGRRDGQKVRGYSWVIGRSVTAATKSHREWMLTQCIAPPEPPYVICISDSGQRHLLYRSAVCYSREQITASLEGERIDYTPSSLNERLELCRRLVAATGKPALADPLSHSAAMRIIAHHGDESLVSLWQAVREQPLSRLAAWLCEPKEECLARYPAAALA